MEIKVLSREESAILWENEKQKKMNLTEEEIKIFMEKEKEERKNWTDDQIVEEAKFILSLPDTTYLTIDPNSSYVDGFLYWLRTKEARAVWNENPYILNLEKYYSQK